MKPTLLERVETLDFFIRQLEKIESKQRSGQFISANRDICQLIGLLLKNKKDLIANQPEEKHD
jgi:hypothetical protein